ncbi:MAG: anaerobic ribonucleoside-triphosphate reductase activating protein [Lachnospiraceae bacterium]|nr:anaerobic ribonucleoside-triphosphate reductase activating protein [Lachnospiraceae bacterium]
MNYHDITHDDMKNGDGLRVVLWTAGCSHGCEGCQNPVTWDPEGGLPFDEAARQEVFSQLEKPYISGITFSGGDPMEPCNLLEVRALALEIRERFPDKTIWVYTGRKWEDVKDDPLMKCTDVLVDGPFEIALKDNLLRWKGSKNQRVIDVPESLEMGRVVIHCPEY